MRLQQAGGLHGKRGRAGNDLAMRHVLPGGADHRQRIDAGMPAEAAIFVGDQQLEEQRIDVLRRRQQPPALVA